MGINDICRFNIIIVLFIIALLCQHPDNSQMKTFGYNFE